MANKLKFLTLNRLALDFVPPVLAYCGLVLDINIALGVLCTWVWAIGICTPLLFYRSFTNDLLKSYTPDDNVRFIYRTIVRIMHFAIAFGLLSEKYFLTGLVYLIFVISLAVVRQEVNKEYIKRKALNDKINGK